MVVHRFPRVAAIVLLEYLAAAALFSGALVGEARLIGRHGDPGAIGGLLLFEALLLLGGLTITGFIVSLIVIAFRQRRWARTRNPASHETSVFGSATVATAFGWAWVPPASPLIPWAANKVFFLISG
jgi:hypothetical protein